MSIVKLIVSDPNLTMTAGINVPRDVSYPKGGRLRPYPPAKFSGYGRIIENPSHFPLTNHGLTVDVNLALRILLVTMACAPRANSRDSASCRKMYQRPMW